MGSGQRQGGHVTDLRQLHVRPVINFDCGDLPGQFLFQAPSASACTAFVTWWNSDNWVEPANAHKLFFDEKLLCLETLAKGFAPAGRTRNVLCEVKGKRYRFAEHTQTYVLAWAKLMWTGCKGSGLQKAPMQPDHAVVYKSYRDQLSFALRGFLGFWGTFFPTLKKNTQTSLSQTNKASCLNWKVRYYDFKTSRQGDVTYLRHNRWKNTSEGWRLSSTGQLQLVISDSSRDFIFCLAWDRTKLTFCLESE